MTPDFLLEAPVEKAKSTAEFELDTPVENAAKSTAESLRDMPVKDAAKSGFEFLRDTPVKDAAKSGFEFLRDTPVKDAAKSSLEFLRGAPPAKASANSSVELLRDVPVEEPAEHRVELLRDVPVEERPEHRVELLRDAPVEEPPEHRVELLRDVPVEERPERRVELLRDAPVEEPVERRGELLRDAPVEEPVERRGELLRDVPEEEPVERRGELLRDAPVEEPVERRVEPLRDAPVEEAAKSSVEFPRDAPAEEAAETSIGFLLDASLKEAAASRAELLGEAPVADAIEDIVQMWEDQAPWETAAGGVRITRDAPAGRSTVAVIGLNQAGLPSALALRRAGFRVAGIDTSSSRLADIRSSRAEALGVSCEELRERLVDPEFVLGNELEAVDSAAAVLIFVPAVLDAQRHPSLEALRRTCAAVVQHARAGQTIVLTSASHVGATRELLVEPLEQRGLRVGDDVFVAFSPERADPGVPEHAQLQVPRVVGGVSERCFAHASQVLRHVSDSLHRVSSPETAEMVKLYESTFRAVNIALAFEMADACRLQQVDPVEVTGAAATKPFGFMPHHPSAGVGGHGVAVDPQSLLHPLRERGRPALLAEEAMRTVAARPRRVAMRAHELLQRSGERLRDARVLVVGATYKPGVADCTGAPAIEIMSWLAAEGVQVEYHDPLIPTLRIDDDDLCSIDPDPRRDGSGFGPEDYDLVIVVTIQPGHDYGWLRRCPQVLDCTYSEPTGRRCLLP
jgi:UDP-N-acetyl-D-glucosamine dehydrogenase